MKQARGVLSLLVLTVVALATGSKIDDFEYLSMTEMCDLLPLDTSFLRPNTCNYWVHCPSHTTTIEEGTCATGLSYNKDRGRCTMAENVECPYDTTAASNNTIVNVCANEKDGTFLPDSTSYNCQGYLLCKGHREVKANCPNELIFNPQSRSCVYSTQYTCPQSGVKTKSPVCRSLSNNTSLAHEEHCHKYYVCIDDVLYERECADQKAYDVSLGRCVAAANVTCYGNAALPPPENTFCLVNGTTARQGYYADDESCNHYYICRAPVKGKHDTNPQHLRCPLGTYFDYEKLSCRDRLNVRCLLDRCAGSTLTYVNVLGNCQSYGRCVDGVTESIGHCPSEYFFDERSQGCTPTNHNYVACQP
ncbi:peritrophin-44 [Drosophila hydei]|uniref:Peritrophin-44 n=1 Tax=Drosophila hydei TaxID=7224 RepID=A0A6J1M480_DROHY|nr:peritrophin-44 [Drosophila hydei]